MKKLFITSIFALLNLYFLLTLIIQITVVTAITRTTNNHDAIRSAVGEHPNFNIVTLNNIPKEEKFGNIVFCAPPSGSEDYPGDVKKAADNLWAGPEEGRFVFTSSGGM